MLPVQIRTEKMKEICFISFLKKNQFPQTASNLPALTIFGPGFMTNPDFLFKIIPRQ